MPVTNREVVDAWKSSASAVNHRKSFSTDGQRLWSYALLIGDTCKESGTKILRDYTAKGRWGFQSQTTSCHVGIARQYAAEIVDS